MSVDLPNPADKRARVQQMFDSIAGRYDILNDILTFGLDRYWRRTAIKALDSTENSTVIDLACGPGNIAKVLESNGVEVVGVDLSIGMLEASITDAPLIQGDLLALPICNETFDGAISGFALRNLTDIQTFLGELMRVLKPGGRAVLLDLSAPKNKLLRVGYELYFGKVVPFIGGLFSDRYAYGYLPKSLNYLPKKAVFLGWFSDAGFHNVVHKSLTGGLAQMYVCEKPRDDRVPT